MPDFAFASATYLAGLIRRREIGCLEMLDHFIARIERLDSRLNAAAGAPTTDSCLIGDWARPGSQGRHHGANLHAGTGLSR
jgi:hypothetical protein